jgi:acetyl esterase/lipase
VSDDGDGQASEPAIGPPPPLDADCGPVWRSVSEGVYGGRGPTYDEASLEVIRSFTFVDHEALLADTSYRERTIVGDQTLRRPTVSVYTPEVQRTDGPAPAIFWIHGGGMVTGDRRAVAEALVAAGPVGATVVSIEYRLAPEHPSPAPQDDCITGLRWTFEQAGALGVDPGRIVLGGSSAGGGLAAATALRMAADDGPTLRGLMLCAPMLDDRMSSVSSRQFDDDVPWSRDNNRFGWRSLLGDRQGTADVTPFEAPGRALDLAGLPPTFVEVGSADLFRDEDVDFVSSIWRCGGEAELHVWPGGFHGFDALVPDAPLSIDAVHARRSWLRRILGSGRAGPGDR